jgi:hypothetical protein
MSCDDQNVGPGLGRQIAVAGEPVRNTGGTGIVGGGQSKIAEALFEVREKFGGFWYCFFGIERIVRARFRNWQFCPIEASDISRRVSPFMALSRRHCRVPRTSTFGFVPSMLERPTWARNRLSGPKAEWQLSKRNFTKRTLSRSRNAGSPRSNPDLRLAILLRCRIYLCFNCRLIVAAPAAARLRPHPRQDFTDSS